jgi:DNA adenine methylase
MLIVRNGRRKWRTGSRNLVAAQPFLKWPGGKRWLVPRLSEIIGQIEYKAYREPFLGGGALFFALRPSCAVLSDVNADLINTYRQVKYRANELLEKLRHLPVDQTTYNRLRTETRGSSLRRAVRFLYLNRTAFGGMYRLNGRGDFNVPFGGGERTPAALWEYEVLSLAATALRNARLRVVDFEQSLSEATKGDLVYCDPTYTVAHNNNGFIRYNERNFSWEDQKRLARSCHAAAKRGAFVLISNAHNQQVLELYSPPHYVAVNRMSRLCPQTKYRRIIDEYLFVVPPTTGGKATNKFPRRYF